MSSDSWAACRRVCPFSILPEVPWSPFLGSCEIPSEMKDVKAFDFRELHFPCCTGRPWLLWAGSKCVRERRLWYSWRLLFLASHAIKLCTETQHTQTHTPRQVFWEQQGKYSCAKWNKHHEESLKGIHLALLPKEDLTCPPVCPYATENLCKYLGSRLHWRNQLPFFSLINDENVKSDDMRHRIVWQQHQDWPVPGLKQIASHFPACLWMWAVIAPTVAFRVKNWWTHTTSEIHVYYISLVKYNSISQVNYIEIYVSIFQYNSIILLQYLPMFQYFCLGSWTADCTYM